jgi:hypothetical protein
MDLINFVGSELAQEVSLPKHVTEEIFAVLSDVRRGIAHRASGENNAVCDQDYDQQRPPPMEASGSGQQ